MRSTVINISNLIQQLCDLATCENHVRVVWGASASGCDRKLCKNKIDQLRDKFRIIIETLEASDSENFYLFDEAIRKGFEFVDSTFENFKQTTHYVYHIHSVWWILGVSKILGYLPRKLLLNVTFREKNTLVVKGTASQLYDQREERHYGTRTEHITEYCDAFPKIYRIEDLFDIFPDEDIMWLTQILELDRTFKVFVLYGKKLNKSFEEKIAMFEFFHIENLSCESYDEIIKECDKFSSDELEKEKFKEYLTFNKILHDKINYAELSKFVTSNKLSEKSKQLLISSIKKNLTWEKAEKIFAKINS